jgi:MOSC domain-containing protein YiiM
MTGRVIHISISPGHGRPAKAVESVVAVEGQGLKGDRYYGTRREVTLVASGELAEAAAALGIDSIVAGSTRRNLTIDVASIPRKHGTRIQIGDVTLAVWRDCAPCELMEETVGPGARAALKDRAGVSATVVVGGVISLGDPVSIDDAEITTAR